MASTVYWCLDMTRYSLCGNCPKRYLYRIHFKQII